MMVSMMVVLFFSVVVVSVKALVQDEVEEVKVAVSIRSVALWLVIIMVDEVVCGVVFFLGLFLGLFTVVLLGVRVVLLCCVQLIDVIS